jgi:hypothetical protein
MNQSKVTSARAMTFSDLALIISTDVMFMLILDKDLKETNQEVGGFSKDGAGEI